MKLSLFVVVEHLVLFAAFASLLGFREVFPATISSSDACALKDYHLTANTVFLSATRGFFEGFWASDYSPVCVDHEQELQKRQQAQLQKEEEEERARLQKEEDECVAAAAASAQLESCRTLFSALTHADLQERYEEVTAVCDIPNLMVEDIVLPSINRAVDWSTLR